MLKGIPSILSPELLKVLCEMGHGDRIVIADGNFPIGLVGKGPTIIRCDGHGVPALLDAILQVFPLDVYVAKPVTLMNLLPGDVGRVETPIWDTYKEIVSKYTDAPIEFVERYAFYERAEKAYAVIMSGESALYANIILKKGVVTE